MDITILTDNNSSWFIPYGKMLESSLISLGHNASYVFDKNDIRKGDICFLLSCTKLIQKEFLDLNKSNIVVHASDLPKGKGFSPLQWQILKGFDSIVLTLFEVVEEVDAGPYYLKKEIEFNGTELLQELRETMARKIIEMSVDYVSEFYNIVSIEQSGEETFFPRRRAKDDEIDVNKTISEQFNHFRIADNEKYPLFFYYRGEKFYIKIEKDEFDK